MRKWQLIFGAGSFACVALGQSGVLPQLPFSDWWAVLIDPANILYALAAISLGASAFLWWKEREQARVRYFDMPIRDAINHLARTTPHSFDSSGKVERHFFNLIHKQMCDGGLLVIGTEGEASTPKRIKARKCKNLKPVEVVIPVNPTSPDGVRFSLVDNQPIEFTSLPQPRRVQNMAERQRWRTAI